MSTQEFFRIAAIPNPQKSPVDFTIRLLTEEDIGEVLALQEREFLRRYKRIPSLSPEHLTYKNIASKLTSPDNFAFVVQTDPSQPRISGCVFASNANTTRDLRFNFYSRVTPLTYIIHDMLVATCFRGYGLASELLRSSIEQIRNQPIFNDALPEHVDILLQASVNNIRMLRAALATGFTITDYQYGQDQTNPVLLLERNARIGGEYGNIVHPNYQIISVSRDNPEMIHALRGGAIGVACMTGKNSKKVFLFRNPMG